MSIAGELLERAKKNMREDIDNVKNKYKEYKEERKEKKEFKKDIKGIRKEAAHAQREKMKESYRKEMIKRAEAEGKAQAQREASGSNGNFVDRLKRNIDKGVGVIDYATARPDEKNLPRIAMETRMHDDGMPNIIRMEQKHKPRPSQLDKMFFENPKKKKKQNMMWVR